ncbi:MAG: virulence RhuM family protein [Deltaproteobacteria bacterium]|nr:virulence RhuM family protein [Deltaproteobacteria bacterium]
MRDETGIVRQEAEFLLYQTEDGRNRLEVRFEGDTAWLTQASLAELYQTTPQNITQHIAAIYDEGELDEEETCKPFLQVRQEGSRKVRRSLKFYSLPVIIAVGYRVRSHRGTQFRQWATSRLEEYVVKGFTMDDERLKRAGGGNYFDELLERIRDIRSSEKVFWRKLLEIYATSIDYDPSAEASKRFFATVQNKMHWAVHGQTAAEVVVARADANKPNMGLTTWVGERPRKADASIAKNYLGEDELAALNRIVMAYIEFAELRALDRKPMYMSDWIRKLDDFLKLSERDILTHAGKISHDEAVIKAELEYDRFAEQRRALPAPVEKHFEDAVHDVKLLDKQRAAAPRSKSKTGGARRPRKKKR